MRRHRDQSRREWLTNVVGAAAASFMPEEAAASDHGKLKISAFSKHFHWAGYEEMASLVKEIGFDAVDLTVRPGGHVLPERVADDLPKAVEIVRKAGLSVEMITTGIVDVSTPHTESILRTASQLGIHHYRWGGFRLDDKRDIIAQLSGYKPRVRELASMNAEYKMKAMYHTHSGLRQVGASIWDLHILLADLDTRWVGVNYDIGHATIEGGYGGWINSARLVAPYMHGVALKDFRWERNDKGEWQIRWAPLGEGMVKFAQFFSILKTINFRGPVQMHFEYPELGGAHAGKQVLDIPRDRFVALLHHDLNYARQLMQSAHLL